MFVHVGLNCVGEFFKLPLLTNQIHHRKLGLLVPQNVIRQSLSEVLGLGDDVEGFSEFLVFESHQKFPD